MAYPTALMVNEGIVYFAEGHWGWYTKDGDLIREVTAEEATKLLQSQPLSKSSEK